MIQICLIILIILIFSLRIVFYLHYAMRFKTIESVKPAEWAIVFGAGLNPNGIPTTVLRERLETAAALYRQGKVRRILLSGSNRSIRYNEPEAMVLYIRSLGVPAEAFVPDPDGHRSLESCRRAASDFSIRDSILITQPFHLPRCMFLAEAFGIHTQGVPCMHLHRVYTIFDFTIWETRETAATFRAIIDVIRYKKSGLS